MPDLLLLAEFKLNDPKANSGVFALGRPPALRHRNVAPGTRDRGAAVPEHKDESRVNSIIICYWWNIEYPYGLGSCASIAPPRRTERRDTRFARGLDPIFHCLYKLEVSGRNSGIRPAVGRRTSPESAPAPSPVPANRGGIASAVGSILPCPMAHPTPPCKSANSVQAREG